MTQNKSGGLIKGLATFIVDKRNLFFLLYIIGLVFSLFSMGWVSGLIRWLVAPIPIRKQTTDISAVMTCIKVAREGGTVCLAPEGHRTFHGKTVYMKPGIASLTKKLGLPLALFRIEGGYGVQPRWSDVVRNGKMHAYISRVVEPEEYKAMTDGEKKELKALRKHEKNLKKLEKIQKEAEKTRKELDEARGIDTTKTKGEMDSPLNHPPKVQTKTNTMQPTRLGDDPVQATKPVRQTWGSDLVPERVAEEELPGVKKETPQKHNQIIIEGKELTEENINEFPPHVVEAFKIIQQLIIEKQANENTNQQPVPQQPEDIAETILYLRKMRNTSSVADEIQLHRETKEPFI